MDQFEVNTNHTVGNLLPQCGGWITDMLCSHNHILMLFLHVRDSELEDGCLVEDEPCCLCVVVTKISCFIVPITEERAQPNNVLPHARPETNKSASLCITLIMWPRLAFQFPPDKVMPLVMYSEVGINCILHVINSTEANLSPGHLLQLLHLMEHGRKRFLPCYANFIICKLLKQGNALLGNYAFTLYGKRQREVGVFILGVCACPS